MRKKQRGGMLLDRMDRLIRENVRAFALKLRNGLCASGQSVAVIAGMDPEGDQAVLTALLCSELARQGFSVLAVNMDAGQARLSALLGVRPQACLSEYLAGQVSLLDVIVKTPERNLAFIEGLPPEGAVADVAATPAFRSFLKSAKSRFDFVILNAAPAGYCADAAMLGTLEGLTVLAARDGAFTADELNAVMTNLAEDVRQLKAWCSPWRAVPALMRPADRADQGGTCNGPAENDSGVYVDGRGRLGAERAGPRRDPRL